MCLLRVMACTCVLLTMVGEVGFLFLLFVDRAIFLLGREF